MTSADLTVPLADAVNACLDEAGADAQLRVRPGELVLERPRNREHGDWASNVAMRIAKRAGVAPRELAQRIADRLAEAPAVAAAEVAGPGFINIRLETAAAGELAREIVEASSEYGRGRALAGRRINLEFVSANPTGPIHMGGARWAAVGDSLARVLEASGAEVVREYYFNDHGAQIDRFARSLLAAHLGEPVPEDGYGGDYIAEIAAQVAASAGERLAGLDREAQQELFRREGVELMFAEIKQRLHEFGVDFDVYFHEDSVHASGAVRRAIERLRELGHVFDQDGAVWLRSTQFGDDKDRVIIRSDGTPTYMSGDIGYYLDKRERGFDEAIMMLGADHHGYVGRMMAMCEAFGDEPGKNLQLLIGQMVHLVRDGQPVRMSKRAGTIVSLDDLVDAVGVDAGRYALVRSSVNTTLEVDLDLLASRTNDNPVFFVQYAHARTCAVARNAATAGVDRSDFDAALLDHESESALLGALREFPRIVETAAMLREPHRVARYLEELASLYNRWYDQRRVLPRGDEEVTPLHRTRLWLSDAAGQVLRSGLGLVGVSAPERM